MQSPPHRRSDHVVAAGVVLLAGVLYLVLRGPLGEAASAISILPVAIISTIYGTRPGLLAAAIAFPFNTFVLEVLFDDDPAGITPVSSLISISLFGIAWLFGRFHALRDRLTLETHEHHRAEEALRISEERLRGFLNATPDVIFRLSPDRTAPRTPRRTQPGDRSEKGRVWLYRNLDGLFPKEAVTELLRRSGLGSGPGPGGPSPCPFPWEAEREVMQISLAPGGDGDVVAIARDVTEFAASEEE